MNDEPCMCGTPFTCLADEHDHEVAIPCCTYRDHYGDPQTCSCPDHPASPLHPFGHLTDYDPNLDNEAFEGWGPGR